MNLTEDFKIDIIDKRKIRTRVLSLNRIPYKVFIITQQVEKETARVRGYANRDLEILQEIAALRKEKPEGYKLEIKDLKEEQTELIQKVEAVEDSGFFNLRFKAIELILSANGIDKDDELMKPETWTEKMDYSTPMSLLKIATEKDIKKIKAAAGKKA